MTRHTFNDIGEQLIASLIKAADDNVTEAKNLQASVKVLTEEINSHLQEHAKLLNDMDARLRIFGEGVLSAHRQFINGQAHENPTP